MMDWLQPESTIPTVLVFLISIGVEGSALTFDPGKLVAQTVPPTCLKDIDWPYDPSYRI